MRDIKLRWFVEDDFVYTDRLSDLDFDCFINVENGEICLFCESGDDDFIGIKYEKADNRTREQFTGIKDINGIDIYEGDILSSPHFENEVLTHRVMWSDKLNGWFLVNLNSKDTYGDGSVQMWVAFKCGTYKVIGNIHQNPELLEK